MPIELSREHRERIGNRILYLLARVVHRLPQRPALAFGRLLARLSLIFSGRYLQRVSEDIGASFPELTVYQCRRLARQFYQRLGESLIEFLRIPYMTTEDITRCSRIEGEEHIIAARALGKGVVCLTAHIGNWELCGVRMGISYPVTSIAKTQEDTALTEFLTAKRQVHGQKIVDMSDIRGCIRVLQRNELLGVLGDVNARVPGAFVQFFGRPAATYTGAAYLAYVTGATLLPAFDERLPDGSHCLRVGPPIPVSRTGDRRRDLLITIMRGQRVIEQEIRRRPQDWYWLLQRWKTRPEDLPYPERVPMEHRDLTPEEVEKELACMEGTGFS